MVTKPFAITTTVVNSTNSLHHEVDHIINDVILTPGRSCPDLTKTLLSQTITATAISTQSELLDGEILARNHLSSGRSSPNNGISISNTGSVSNSGKKKRPPTELALDLSEVDFTKNSPDLELMTPGQKCFGEKSDVERVLDSRCPCLQSKCLHLSGTLLGLLIVGILLIIFFRRYLKDCLMWLEHADGWVSGLLFILMFTLVSFPMTWGYIFLNVAAGYLYGFLMGLVTVNVSVLVGVSVSLVVCRKVIRGFVMSKLQSEHLKAIIKVVESRRGFKVLVLTRLTPIPFGLQNGLFAITKMPLSKCLLGSFIGLLPTQALNAYVGSTLRTMEDVVHSNSAGGYLILGVQVGISGFLMWYVIRRARYELNKACLPNTSEIDYTALTNFSSSASSSSSCASSTTNGYDDYHYHHQNNKDNFWMSRTPQPLTRANSGTGFRYQALPHFDSEEDLTTTIQKNSINSKNPVASTKKKQGHKRAHSASAILYAMQNRDDND